MWRGLQGLINARLEAHGSGARFSPVGDEFRYTPREDALSRAELSARMAAVAEREAAGIAAAGRPA